MNILMLTDRMEQGGAETHILTLCAFLVKKGHRVSVASSGGALTYELEKSGAVHLTVPLCEKKPHAIMCAYAKLRALIKKGNFDVIHSHSRLASTLAEPIAKAERVCFVTTAHARFSSEGLRGKLSRWGESTIAVSEDLKQYLVENYSLSPENITVVQNGVDAERFCPRCDKTERLHTVKRDFPRIAFLSRLDADCSRGAELLCAIAPRLYERYGYIEILIGGGGSELARINELARQTNRAIGYRCVKVLGAVRDTPSFFRSADVFVGVSRAAIEASFCGLSVILCGNEGFSGRLTEENFRLALVGNFCARGLGEMSEERLMSALDGVLGENCESSRQSAAAVRELMLRVCNADACAERVERFYGMALDKAKTRGREVLLCGYYGFGNMGDDALLRAAIKRVKRELGDVGICALTRNGRRDSRLFGIRCVSRKNPLSVLQGLKRCKYFVFGGGTLLQDSTSRRSLFYYASLLGLASSFGASCYLWGNGIGELSSARSRRIVKYALGRCQMIGLRDKQSFLLASSLLGENGTDRLTLESDLAAECMPCEKSRAELLLFSLFEGQAVPPFVIIALNGRRRDGIDRMFKKLDSIKERGLYPVFAVMYEREDRELSEYVCRMYGGRLLHKIDFCDLVGVASYSRGVYSMRLHALIAAKNAGVPFFGFGNDVKIKAFCDSECSRGEVL